jgi:Toprim domain
MDRRSIVKPLMLVEAEELARLVIPGGRKIGLEWEGPGPDGRTWSVNIGSGSRRGVFAVWSAGLSGDIVKFVIEGLCDGRFEEAMRWAYRRYHLDGQAPSAADLERQRCRATQIALASQKAEAEDAARKLEKAAEIWKLPGDDRNALVYLASRGLRGVPMRYVRFGNAVPYDESRIQLPAMLFPVIRLENAAFTGVHRTFLEPDADGAWRKVRGREAKKGRGLLGGGIIPLLDGAGVPWRVWLTDPDRATQPLALAEGVENALSVATAFPGARCCAFISAGNLAKVAPLLPRQADPIIFVADRDAASSGRDGIRKTRDDAIALWLSQGRTVRVYAPPRNIKDANDALNALNRDRGYQPHFACTPSTLDFRTVLAEARVVAGGDPVALWWEKVTGARWDDGGEPALRLHAALATIEQPDVMLPAAVMPVIGIRGEPIGAVVAWLAVCGEAWGLAPLMLPIRILGHARGLVVLRKVRRERDPALLVLGLESALVTARVARRTVLCAIDASHAACCAPGVPEDIDTCDLFGDNEDVTLGGEVLTKIARERLDEVGLGGEHWRPWNEFVDVAAMLRDRDLEKVLAR